MNNPRLYRIILRTILILLHAFVNVVITSKLMELDISSSWLYTLGFVVACLVLTGLFIFHIFSFYHFIKTKT